MTITETNKVTTKNEGNNGEVAEVEVEVEVEAAAAAAAATATTTTVIVTTVTNSEKSNSSNNGIGRSNSKSCYVETKILKHPDKNKTIGNKVGYDGENSSEI